MKVYGIICKNISEKRLLIRRQGNYPRLLIKYLPAVANTLQCITNFIKNNRIINS